MPGGRPFKLNKEQLEELCELIVNYTDDNELPILSEFAYKHLPDFDITLPTLYDYDQLSKLVKIMMQKKETYLERMALAGEVNTTMAIFSLKQIGWSDKQQIEHTVDLSEAEESLKKIYGKFTGKDSK